MNTRHVMRLLHSISRNGEGHTAVDYSNTAVRGASIYVISQVGGAPRCGDTSEIACVLRRSKGKGQTVPTAETNKLSVPRDKRVTLHLNRDHNGKGLRRGLGTATAGEQEAPYFGVHHEKRCRIRPRLPIKSIQPGRHFSERGQQCCRTATLATGRGAGGIRTRVSAQKQGHLCSRRLTSPLPCSSPGGHDRDERRSLRSLTSSSHDTGTVVGGAALGKSNSSSSHESAILSPPLQLR